MKKNSFRLAPALCAFAAVFPPLPAAAGSFDCMGTPFDSGREIISYEEYKSCMAENFPDLPAARADYKKQAAEMRQFLADEAAYAPVPAEYSRIPPPPEIHRLSSQKFQGQFEWGFLRDAAINIAPRQKELDSGAVLENKRTGSTLFKRGAFYYQYLWDMRNYTLWVIKLDKAFLSGFAAPAGADKAQKGGLDALKFK